MVTMHLKPVLAPDDLSAVLQRLGYFNLVAAVMVKVVVVTVMILLRW